MNRSQNNNNIRRPSLNLGWYDLTVAGLVLVVAVGAIIRTLGIGG